MADELAAANAAWKSWTESNPGLCNTDYLSFLAGWAACAESEEANERHRRERLAAEIEAETEGEWVDAYRYGLNRAASTVRGATADTDPAGGDEIPLSQRCVRTGCTNRIAVSSVWYCHEHEEPGQGPTGR